MTSPHLDPNRKMDFVFLLEARDSNPNGDPDAGGMPRTDPVSGQGLITDVALKRKIRNTVALLNQEEKKPGYDIYVESGVALNSQHERAYAADALGPDASQLDAQQWMCRAFFDVRMFGAVMTTGQKNRQAGRVRGPVQLTFSRSVDPITPLEFGITRVTPTKPEDLAKKDTEMGSKHIVPYGLYRGEGHFSAPLAASTGVTSDDLAIFWRAFTLMFDHDRAAARGELNLRGLYVFVHDDKFGNAPARQLLDRVTVKGPGDATARSFSDYQVDVHDADLPKGVTLTTLIG
ncbi:type I-C CRISPR-associated protein Cas7/Csd2 [Streptomyces spiralis]|uniref:Type I-C CRISPR-associated protein Cas7/Csd2 n=1 Tax=Streptomyces spiralis TaxID=66376 RepID=A0A919A0P8_9ACTN|nr:type I-C CRISPR-associated protein Cas7/Csd2 [Streptomyces spiralis]GHE80353.1 type I-C CRISPR-associated protein Cas7/Csd2 [Streptomyces spiralis]